MTEKITTYLTMGLVLALIVHQPEVIAKGLTATAAGIGGIVSGIVGGG